MKTLFKHSLVCSLLLLPLTCARDTFAQHVVTREQSPIMGETRDVFPLTVFKNLQSGKKQTVVVYGTSLTIHGQWATALKEYFDKQFPGQVTYINSARAGMGSNWGRENLQTRVLDKNPDLVFIEFAINDASKNNHTSTKKAHTNLDTMVKALRAHNPQVDIVLQTMDAAWDSQLSLPKHYGSDRPNLAAYYEVYRQYARENSLPLVDNYPNWLALQQESAQKYQEMVPDGIHPSPTASLAVTWPAIESLLEETRKESMKNQTALLPSPNLQPTNFQITPTIKTDIAASSATNEIVIPIKKENFQIYLLMGQSNMVGRDIRTLGTQQSSTHALALNGEGRWIIAKDPLHEDKRIAPGVGPGLSFALEMVKATPAVTIGLVPCAVGNTRLSRWSKGGDLYDKAVSRAKAAAQVGVIKGVLWHQGEAETGKKENADTYESRLCQMFKDLRGDLGQPDLPIVVGQLGEFLTPAKHPYAGVVRNAIQHTSVSCPKVGFADAVGLSDKGDKLHFSADAEKVLGTRYAQAMLMLQNAHDFVP